MPVRNPDMFPKRHDTGQRWDTITSQFAAFDQQSSRRQEPKA
jgi:hypothetical protein